MKKEDDKDKNFLWVRQCIKSCIAPFHIEGCHILLHLYRIKYANEPGVKDDYETLLTEINNKETSIGIDA